MECLYCDNKVLDKVDCVVCDEGPFCAKCRIQCPCDNLPVHYLCAMSSYALARERDNAPELETKHECGYAADGEGCDTPACDKNVIECPVCLINCNSTRRFCDKHFPLVQEKVQALADVFRGAKKKRKKN